MPRLPIRAAPAAGAGTSQAAAWSAPLQLRPASTQTSAPTLGMNAYGAPLAAWYDGSGPIITVAGAKPTVDAAAGRNGSQIYADQLNPRSRLSPAVQLQAQGQPGGVDEQVEHVHPETVSLGKQELEREHPWDHPVPRAQPRRHRDRLGWV